MKTIKNDQLKFFEYRTYFDSIPNIRVFFPHESEQEAYSNIIDGVRKRAGLMILTGAEGIGKTLVTKKAAHELANDTCRVLVHRGEARFSELVNYFCRAFNVMTKISSELQSQALSRFLIERHRRGENFVVFLDELRSVEKETVSELRTLCRPSGATENILQVIFVGNPMIEAMLHSICGQSIRLRCKLTPLSDHEISRYINYYLNLANFDGESPFLTDAIECIAFLSRGIPGKINLLCSASLVIAGIEGHQSISSDLVEKAATQLSLSPTNVNVSKLTPSEVSKDHRYNTANSFMIRTSQIDSPHYLENPIPLGKPLTLEDFRKEGLPLSKFIKNLLEVFWYRMAHFVRDKKSRFKKPIAWTALTFILATVIGVIANTPTEDVYDPVVDTVPTSPAAHGLSPKDTGLLNSPETVDKQNLQGRTALMNAAFDGHIKVVEVLLGAGANPNLRDKEGNTGLMLAATNGQRNVTELLLHLKVDVNNQNSDGWTALMFSAWSGHTEIVKLLLTSGADTNLKTVNQFSASSLASIQGHWGIVTMIETTRTQNGTVF